MNELLRFLLASPIEADSADALAGFWEARRALRARFALPIDRAIACAFTSDRLGFAFAAGYQAALSAMIPALCANDFAALCATEEGGAHPRAIRASLAPRADGRGYSLDGKKRWATMASKADHLFIVASIGADSEGKNRLRLARIPADREGVRVVRMPDAPFAPEIPHAEVELEGVRVDESELLPGDGYDVYLKPFRTIEDVHVHGALLGYLISVGRRYRWPTDALSRLTAAVVCARALGEASTRAVSAIDGEHATTSAALHVALGGLLGDTKRILEDTAELWAAVDEAERARWERDRPLLEVAGRARAARLAKAWETLSSAPLAAPPDSMAGADK